MGKHVNITISGRVQGVGFRWRMKILAESLGITGWVRNEADGMVYVEAEGAEEALQKLTEWCKKGPSGVKVTKTEVKRGEIKGYKSWKIL